jgi:single-strand DNA-binding protein
MNKVILIGRICNDIELRYFENEVGVATINVAVPRAFKNAKGEYETDFIKVVLYNQVAEVVNKNCKKGDQIAIDGRIQVRNYEYEGKPRTDTSVVCEKITLLNNKPKENVKKETKKVDPFAEFGKEIEIEDNELPF